MERWIDELATALGEPIQSDAETDRLLGIARDIAHRVERRITPLAAFQIGAAVGRREAGGASREEAMAGVLATVEGLLPEAPAQG